MNFAYIETNSMIPKPEFHHVFCIQYPAWFDQYLIKVNAMQQNVVRKLDLDICKTDNDVRKIDCSRLETFDMVIASFSMDEKNGKFTFFEKTFLLADIGMNIVFKMVFLILNNVKVNSSNQEHMWRLYISDRTLLNTRWVKPIGKKKFAVVALY